MSGVLASPLRSPLAPPAVDQAVSLAGARVRLRPWRTEDRDAFFEINADPVAMRYFPATLTREASDRLAERIEATLRERHWGLWALEIPGVAPFGGFVGLSIPSFSAPFMPAVEVGWRLAPRLWGCGYASEAARLAVAFGFERLELDEIVSFTAVANEASRRVMQAIGMRQDPHGDFAHPAIPAESPLSRHVLYRLACPTRPAAN